MPFLCKTQENYQLKVAPSNIYFWLNKIYISVVNIHFPQTEINAQRLLTKLLSIIQML